MRLVLIVLLVAACGSSLGNYDYTKEPDPRNHELTLGVGDVVGINVWDQKELNTEATIRPDGTITMPLVGDLQAANVTPSQLKAKILVELAKYVKSTEVTVAVKAWKSYRFTMEGEVSKAGVFTSDQYVTVLEALAMASGLTRFARRDGIILFRKDARTGAIRRIPIDYDELASGKRSDMNIYVLPGDIIYVP